MKLTDAFSKVIKNFGIKNVFGLQGGAVVHFFDSLEKHKINVTYTNHEVSAALAATSYSKATKNLGCAIVTTGPGTTNAITGLMAAWQDSVPVIFISGQARSTHVSYGKKVRQVGTQEVNICDVVKPLTKYTKFISKKEGFLPELYKAIKISKEGRPGPVWLDVALDIQWADIEHKKNLILEKKRIPSIRNQKKYNQILKYLDESSKPLILVGAGVKLKNCENDFINFVKKYNIPFVTSWNSADISHTDDLNHLGIIGMSGQRGANKAVFKADLLICLGTHLPIPHTTTLFKTYAPNSKKIIINIDIHELKNLNVKFDMKICDDVQNFFEWIKKNKFKKKFNWFDKKYFKKINWYEPKKTKEPNSNIFIRQLTKKIENKTCIIVDGGGTALYSGFQSSYINKGNKIICSSSISSMGTGLAETIGVAKSNRFKNLICIIGDGSFLMNIQDLQTIIQDKINVKILIINNNGYLAIRHTQKEFLKAKYYGTHPKYNLTMPDYKKVSKAFGIKYIRVDKEKDTIKSIHKLLNSSGPIICELITSEDQPSLFKQGYKKNTNGLFEPQPLSEMFPFISKPIANTNN